MRRVKKGYHEFENSRDFPDKIAIGSAMQM